MLNFLLLKDKNVLIPLDYAKKYKYFEMIEILSNAKNRSKNKNFKYKEIKIIILKCIWIKKKPKLIL